jgi:hypothetical protein
VSTVDGVVNVQPIGSEAILVYLAFTVIVITGDSSYVEIVVFTAEGITPGTNPIYYANSSKFGYESNITEPFRIHGFEWVTGLSNVENHSETNYLSQANMNTYALGVNGIDYELKLSFVTGQDIYMTGFKVNLVLVGKVIGEAGTAFDFSYTQSGNTLGRDFQTNLGIHT